MKQPILKPLRIRWNLSDFHYSLMIYFIVLVGALLVVFAAPAQWDFMREANAFGYPRWAGNIMAVAAIFGGNSIAHALWETVKRLADITEPAAG